MGNAADSHLSVHVKECAFIVTQSKTFLSASADFTRLCFALQLRGSVSTSIVSWDYLLISTFPCQ